MPGRSAGRRPGRSGSSSTPGNGPGDRRRADAKVAGGRSGPPRAARTRQGVNARRRRRPIFARETTDAIAQVQALRLHRHERQAGRGNGGDRRDDRREQREAHRVHGMRRVARLRPAGGKRQARSPEHPRGIDIRDRSTAEKVSPSGQGAEFQSPPAAPICPRRRGSRAGPGRRPLRVPSSSLRASTRLGPLTARGPRPGWRRRSC